MVSRPEWKNPQLRCLRVTTYRSGIKDDPVGVGRSPDFERDSLAEPHRESGDKCGPTGLHWEATP